MENNGTREGQTPELDLSGAMSKLLENPEMLSRVKELAGMLGGSGMLGGAPQSGNNSDNSGSPTPPVKDSSPDSGGAAPQLGILPSKAHSAENAALLKALKPYLSEVRRKKVDYLLKMIQLLSLVDLSGFNFQKK